MFKNNKFSFKNRKMGNCLKSKPVLPVHNEKKKDIEIKPIELKPIDKNLYGLTIEIWGTETKEIYDIRFNFYSKNKELDQILYKSIHYICLGHFNVEINPINYRNQTNIILNKTQLNILKSEIDKIIYANIKWRKLA